MAQKSIREFDGKQLLANNWLEYMGDTVTKLATNKVLVDAKTDLKSLGVNYPWLTEQKLVIKPDQLFGKRGKHGLIKLDADLDTAIEWIEELMGKEVVVNNLTGKLTNFLIEPFIKHKHEFYVSISSERDGDLLMFSTHGGVDVEDSLNTIKKITIGIKQQLTILDVSAILSDDIEDNLKQICANFIKGLFDFYRGLSFTYLEINPFTIVDENIIVPLDLVARVDDTAQFEKAKKWGELSFPAPFGREFSTEELYIKSIDDSSGASLKFTLLNPKGRIWTMVAGGGASVIYTDTIVNFGLKDELANYGEYSGAPTTDETYEYAKTMLKLMTAHPEANGRAKFLLIGGSIANFTDVAKTFLGIIRAIRQFSQQIKENNIQILIRRGGPNYQEGLAMMRQLGIELNIPLQAFGPETHITHIVKLTKETIEQETTEDQLVYKEQQVQGASNG